MSLETADRVFSFPLGTSKTEGKVVRYNASSLIAYMVATGDFHEPTSRLPFTDLQLQELDNIAKARGWEHLSSVAEAKRERASEYAERRELLNMTEGVERCLGEVVSCMLEIVDATEAAALDVVDPLPLVAK